MNIKYLVRPSVEAFQIGYKTYLKILYLKVFLAAHPGCSFFHFLSSMASFQEDLDSEFRDELHLLLFCVIQMIDALQILFYSQVPFSSCGSLLQCRQVQPVRIYHVFRDIYSSRNKMQHLFLHYNVVMDTVCTSLVETPEEMDQFLCILI